MKPKLRINPRTGLPHHVWKTKSGYRFEIQVNGKRYSTITYSNPYVAAYKAHTSDWYLTCGSER